MWWFACVCGLDVDLGVAEPRLADEKRALLTDMSRPRVVDLSCGALGVEQCSRDLAPVDLSTMGTTDSITRVAAAQPIAAPIRARAVRIRTPSTRRDATTSGHSISR
jgi:hypothetical protein